MLFIVRSMSNFTKRKTFLDDGISEIESDECDLWNSDPSSGLNICEENSNVTSKNSYNESQKNNTFDSSIANLLQENDSLREEISNLKRLCSCNRVENEKPVIKIIFTNRNVANQCKEKLLLVIENFINDELKIDESDLEIKVWSKSSKTALVKTNENIITPLKKNNSENSLKQTFIEISSSDEGHATNLSKTNVLKDTLSKNNVTATDVSSLITVDTVPQEKNVDNKNYDYPRYRVKIDSVEEKNTNDHLSRAQCFNCDQRHNLKDCPFPKNWNRIQLARQNFQANASRISNSRYHGDEDDDKYKNLKPGKISKSLQRALGLKPYEIPLHVYKMRVHGYPPGWWQEALDETNSLLNIIIDKDSHDSNKMITERMIHEYIGFNVEPDEDLIDEHWKFKVPPFQEIQSKKAFLQYNEEQQKLKSLVNNNKSIESLSSVNAEVADMDVVELDDVEIDITNQDNASKRLNSPILLSSSDDADNKSLDNSAYHKKLKRSISPNLSDAEPEVKKLKMSENSESVVVLSDNSQTNSDCLILNHSCDPCSCDSDCSLANLSQDDKGIKTDEKRRLQQKVHTPKMTGKKSEEKLTPILTRLSNFPSLPTSEKFSKDMGPMLYFENLPDAVGKYDQMKNVLKNVRGKLKQLQTSNKSTT